MSNNQYSFISNEFIEKNIEMWEDEIKSHKTNSFKYGYCQGKLMLLHELKQQLIPSVEIPQQEISDEEIEGAARTYTFDEYQKVIHYESYDTYNDFINGAKWYREQLKQR